MTDAIEPRSIQVTGVERQDPALRKLARAFITLARHQLGDKEGALPGNKPSPSSADEASRGAAAGSEANHG